MSNADKRQGFFAGYLIGYCQATRDVASDIGKLVQSAANDVDTNAAERSVDRAEEIMEKAERVYPGRA